MGSSSFIVAEVTFCAKSKPLSALARGTNAFILFYDSIRGCNGVVSTVKSEISFGKYLSVFIYENLLIFLNIGLQKIEQQHRIRSCLICQYFEWYSVGVCFIVALWKVIFYIGFWNVETEKKRISCLVIGHCDKYLCKFDVFEQSLKASVVFLKASIIYPIYDWYDSQDL